MAVEISPQKVLKQVMGAFSPPASPPRRPLSHSPPSKDTLVSIEEGPADAARNASRNVLGATLWKALTVVIFTWRVAKGGVKVVKRGILLAHACYRYMKRRVPPSLRTFERSFKDLTADQKIAFIGEQFEKAPHLLLRLFPHILTQPDEHLYFFEKLIQLFLQTSFEETTFRAQLNRILLEAFVFSDDRDSQSLRVYRKIIAGDLSEAEFLAISHRPGSTTHYTNQDLTHIAQEFLDKSMRISSGTMSAQQEEDARGFREKYEEYLSAAAFSSHFDKMNGERARFDRMVKGAFKGANSKQYLGKSDLDESDSPSRPKVPNDKLALEEVAINFIFSFALSGTALQEVAQARRSIIEPKLKRAEETLANVKKELTKLPEGSEKKEGLEEKKKALQNEANQLQGELQALGDFIKKDKATIKDLAKCSIPMKELIWAKNDLAIDPISIRTFLRFPEKIKTFLNQLLPILQNMRADPFIDDFPNFRVFLSDLIELISKEDRQQGLLDLISRLLPTLAQKR